MRTRRRVVVAAVAALAGRRGGVRRRRAAGRAAGAGDDEHDHDQRPDTTAEPAPTAVHHHRADRDRRAARSTTAATTAADDGTTVHGPGRPTGRAAPPLTNARRRERGVQRHRPPRRVRLVVHGVPPRRRRAERAGVRDDQRPLRRHLRQHVRRRATSPSTGRRCASACSPTPRATSPRSRSRPCSTAPCAAPTSRCCSSPRHAATLIGLPSYSLAPPPRDGRGDPRRRRAGRRRAAGRVGPARWRRARQGPASRLVELEWLWDAATSSDCARDPRRQLGLARVRRPRPDTRVVGIVNTTTIGAGPGVTCWLGSRARSPRTGRRRPRRPHVRHAGRDLGRLLRAGLGPGRAGLPGRAGADDGVDAPLRAVQPGATWAATIATGNGGPAVAKAGPVGTTDCREEAGYALAATPTFDDPLPLAEGVAVLCAAALDDRGGLDTAQAGTAVMVVDGTPPDQPIALGPDQRGRRPPRRADLRPAGALLVRRQGGPGIDCARPRRLRRSTAASRSSCQPPTCPPRSAWLATTRLGTREHHSRSSCPEPDAFRAGRVRVPR